MLVIPVELDMLISRQNVTDLMGANPTNSATPATCTNSLDEVATLPVS